MMMKKKKKKKKKKSKKKKKKSKKKKRVKKKVGMHHSMNTYLVFQQISQRLGGWTLCCENAL